MKTLPDRPTPLGDRVQQIDPTVPDQNWTNQHFIETISVLYVPFPLHLNSLQSENETALRIKQMWEPQKGSAFLFANSLLNKS